MLCPYCGEQNIDGADSCESCHSALDFLSRPRAKSDIERRLLREPVSVLEPSRPILVDAASPVRNVLQLLKTHSIGCALVMEQGKLAGIFSERDALMRLNVDAAALGDRPIGDYMTSAPATITMHASLAYALHMMDIGHYRHLPVVDGDRVVGVISIRDILRYTTQQLVASDPG